MRAQKGLKKKPNENYVIGQTCTVVGREFGEFLRSNFGRVRVKGGHGESFYWEVAFRRHQSDFPCPKEVLDNLFVGLGGHPSHVVLPCKGGVVGNAVKSKSGVTTS